MEVMCMGNIHTTSVCLSLSHDSFLTLLLFFRFTSDCMSKEKKR